MYIYIYTHTQLENTPLYVAAVKGHSEVVEALTRAGADVNFVHNNVSCSIYIRIYMQM